MPAKVLVTDVVTTNEISHGTAERSKIRFVGDTVIVQTMTVNEVQKVWKTILSLGVRQRSFDNIVTKTKYPREIVLQALQQLGSEGKIRGHYGSTEGDFRRIFVL